MNEYEKTRLMEIVTRLELGSKPYVRFNPNNQLEMAIDALKSISLSISLAASEIRTLIEESNDIKNA